MRRYKNLLPLLVHTEEGSYKQGEVFEKEFSAEDEAENLASGLLELQPSTYRVIGGSEVDGVAPGEEFEAAISIGREALLIEGGHIERVEEKPKPAPKSKKKEAKS
jgi:hypothetical protein